ncbi:MAG: hypothetical protein VKJ46_09300 [Leptolyngbyaceae bacterium]|nr:hypothetical protein [Leptolyngbyaceae bacterium]
MSLQILLQQLQSRLQVELGEAALGQDSPLQVQCAFKQGKLMILAQHGADVTPNPQAVFPTLEQAVRTFYHSQAPLVKGGTQKARGSTDSQPSQRSPLDSPLEREMDPQAPLIKGGARRAGGSQDSQPSQRSPLDPPLERGAPLHRRSPLDPPLERGVGLLRPEGSDGVDSLDFPQEVQLFMRVAGQKQYHAFHSFNLEPLEPSVPDRLDLDFAEPDPSEPALLESDSSNPDPGELDLSEPVALPTTAVASDVREVTDLAIIPVAPDQELSGNEIPKADDPLKLATLMGTSEMGTSDPNVAPVSELNSAQSRQPLTLPWMVAGIGVGLLALLGGFYAVTRPCVIGSCSALTTAQQLGQQSVQSLQQQPAPNLDTVRQKLAEATQMLETIPAWSRHHQSAQTLIQTYQVQSAEIAQLTQATDQAQLAIQKGQSPPHPPQTWTEIQGLWQGAIAQLQKVPSNSTTYAFAQRQLKVYQANLGIINQRLASETQAEKQLNAAKATLRLAETRQGIAQSPDSWRQVQVTWQVAIKALEQVPKGTTAYQEAQELQAIYQPKLAAARDRATKEQISAQSYNRALSFANQAQTYEKQNQTTPAIAAWSNAVANINQVATDTFYALQAQPLASSYSQSLQQLEEKLRTASIFQKTQTDLSRTCAGSPQICTYTLTPTLITVQLTAPYMQTITRTVFTARYNRDSNTQVEIRSHLKTLQVALEAISTNSGIPIELYNPTNVLMGRYIPTPN